MTLPEPTPDPRGYLISSARGSRYLSSTHVPFSHINLLLGNTLQPEILFSSPCCITGPFERIQQEAVTFYTPRIMGLGRQSNSDIIYLIIILFFEGPDKYLKNRKVYVLSFQ